ncbi:MAG TPA: CAP domain-containing protein [Candidatus Limnocylindrales bacterium]
MPRQGTMMTIARRLGPIALAALLLATIVPIVAAADDLTVAGAEAKVAGLLNDQRQAIGRVVLRRDARLAAIARGRSEDMASKGYFSHQEPDGDWAWDLMSDAGIRWFGAGENIAWNTHGTLSESASAVSRQWHDSSGHYKLLTSADYNYFGIGLAVDGSGKKIWTAIFMKGPDRTGAWAKFRTDSNASADTVSTASSGARRRVRIEWKGADRRLQVLTAGFASYQVQKRRPGVTAWTTVYSATTRDGMVRRLLKGQLYEYRIRARDKKGNVGEWSRSLFIRP